MGCTKSKSKYNIIIDDQDQPYHLNIYKETDNEYIFSGVLKPNLTKFYLLFIKEDEERLPLAISFVISDDSFTSHQYQFLKLKPNQSIDSLENITIQFPDEDLSQIYSCDVSPSYPFIVDIYGRIKLKDL
jgi:hypothetical protein